MRISFQFHRFSTATTFLAGMLTSCRLCWTTVSRYVKIFFFDNQNIFAGENYSDAAMPDAFCSDWLTFKGKGKEEGVQVHSDDKLGG